MLINSQTQDILSLAFVETLNLDLNSQKDFIFRFSFSQKILQWKEFIFKCEASLIMVIYHYWNLLIFSRDLSEEALLCSMRPMWLDVKFRMGNIIDSEILELECKVDMLQRISD